MHSTFGHKTPRSTMEFVSYLLYGWNAYSSKWSLLNKVNHNKPLPIMVNYGHPGKPHSPTIRVMPFWVWVPLFNHGLLWLIMFNCGLSWFTRISLTMFSNDPLSRPHASDRRRGRDEHINTAGQTAPWTLTEIKCWN